MSLKKGVDFTGVSVIYLCHDGQGKFVMAKRSNKSRDEFGRWDCGGGGLEFGDTIEETLRREIKEEYDADVLGFEFLGFRDVHRLAPPAAGEHEGLKTHWVALDFKVLVDPKQVKINEPHKFDDLGWFDLNSLPSPMHSQHEYFFEKYKDKLN
jgi:8-oxo-dGTP pyrophosphatase MutT (NUDIX family)